MKHPTRILLLTAALLLGGGARLPVPTVEAKYSIPEGAVVTRLPAPGRPRTLVIEAATDITFMRPFLVDFQSQHPDIAILYVDMLSNSLLDHALAACRSGRDVPDAYVSVATDHLVRLANDGCAANGGIEGTMPWREWRDEVYAFALEPAVFVYNRLQLPDGIAPRSHLALVEALRDRPEFWLGRIGTYDIRKSGLAFNYAEFDARETSMFGRLIESLGRSDVRLYCCSSDMVAAVRRGSIRLAYNVQLSYALAAARQDPHVGVILPADYQAVQSRAVMLPAAAPDPALGRLFLEYLLSSRAQEVERRILTPAAGSDGPRFDPTHRLLNQADVNSTLLRLQDRARRLALIQSWAQAVAPPR